MKNGFTMIELIVVIAIISIISAMAIPRFANTVTFKQRTSFDQVLFITKLAQKTAIAQRRNIYITQQSNTLILCYNNTIPCPNNQTVTLQGQTITANLQNVSTTIPSGLNFNSSGIVSISPINFLVGTQIIYIEGTTGYVHN